MLKHTLKVEGLHCEKCEAKVNENIRTSLAVKSVTSSHVDGEVVVISKDTVELVDIKKIIVGLGHRIVDAKTEKIEEDKKGFFSFLKRNK